MHKLPGAVRNPMSPILAKLQVCDRTRAVLKAIEHGLIQSPVTRTFSLK